MSDEHKKFLGDAIYKIVVGLAAILLTIAGWLSKEVISDIKEGQIEVKSEIKGLRKDFDDVGKTVVDHGAQLRSHDRELDRLDRIKQDRHP